MRNYRLDNGKGVLIYLVVLGHFLEKFGGWDNQFLRLPLTLIYMFHMPAFVFMAGMTTAVLTVRSRVLFLAVTFILFQSLYLGLVKFKTGSLPTSVFQPYWILWFLISLIWWTVFAKLMDGCRYKLLIISGFSILVGCVSFINYKLSASRTFIFFPFFISGSIYGEVWFRRFVALGYLRWMPLIVFLLFGYCLYVNNIEARWFYGSLSFESMHSQMLNGLMQRFGLQLISAISVISFIFLLPFGEGRLSRIGAASFSIFLLHGFFVIASGPLFALVKESMNSISLFILAVAFSCTVTLLCAMPVWGRLIKSIVNYILSTRLLKAVNI